MFAKKQAAVLAVVTMLAGGSPAWALTGDVTGFTGPLAFSNWTQYGSPQAQTVLYSLTTPAILILQNYQPWADSWAWVAPPAATVAGEYMFSYSGYRTAQCPGTIILPDNSWNNLTQRNGVVRAHVEVGQTVQIALRGASQSEGVCHPALHQIQLIITNLKFLADYPQ